ncbi:Canalicular multispecific organic anion transporter 2 [Araneus ventricosus]|uniref:Canalicular multispecific organic anion transporter 2 n=1 Tax=Araneus ventricosus TaxID=182803 RepID=A0A4Y2RQV9_ARAVE|nr:Canalicular multispecific organic anion transporter 2 [Araneus ventricosus]
MLYLLKIDKAPCHQFGFGKDINSVDIDIPNRLQSVTTIIVAIIGSLVVIISTLPIFMVVMIPLCVVYIFIQCFYMTCSRQVRRLQSVTLSPMISFFSESVQGASTIRAFAAQYDFIDRQDKQIDTNCRAFYSSTLLNRWLSIRLQFLGNTVVFVTALLAVIERRSFTPALVGLILSYALSVTENLATFVRVFTQVESQMIAVERIHEYSDLQSEASWETECVRFSRDDWPSRGEVIFREYTMRYRSGTELVLRDINIDIPPGQKVL